MAGAPRGGLWRGAIASEANAKYITTLVSWIFICFGAITLMKLPQALGSPSELAAALVTAVVMAGPAAFLLTRRSRIAAAVQLGVAGLLLAGCLFGFAYTVVKLPTAAVFMALLPLFWAPLTWLCWRAFQAASYLRDLKARAAGAAAAFR